MARVEGGGRRQAQQLGADAHHLPAQVGLRCLPADPSRQDGVADERVVGDDEANAARRVARGVQDLELELAEVQLIAVEQVVVGGPQELLGVGGVDAGLAAGDLFDVVFAADVAGVAVGRQDVPDRQPRCHLDDLLGRLPGIDHDRFFGRGARDDVAVHLAVELDLDDGELAHKSVFTVVEHSAVIGFSIGLLLVCGFWIYGYFRRRSKKRY